jgi:succinate dehydrogenase/fumarate reductase flavoprotein subunit
MRFVAVVLCVALLTGCFGYNSSSKGWAYVGDSVLIAGGGAALAYGIEDKPAACEGAGCPYHSQLRGGMIAGALLIGAGLIGLLFNATRESVKSQSR